MSDARRKMMVDLLAARMVGDDGSRWGPEGPEPMGLRPKRPEVVGPPNPLPLDELGRRVDPGTGQPPGRSGPPAGGLQAWRDRLFTLPTNPPLSYTPEEPQQFAPNLSPDMQRALLLMILQREGTSGATLR